MAPICGDYGGDGDRGGKSALIKVLTNIVGRLRPSLLQELQSHWLHICQFSDGDEDYNHEEGCRVISNWTQVDKNLGSTDLVRCSMNIGGWRCMNIVHPTLPQL